MSWSSSITRRPRTHVSAGRRWHSPHSRAPRWSGRASSTADQQVDLSGASAVGSGMSARLTVLGFAVATAACTLALGWPTPTHADGASPLVQYMVDGAKVGD